MRRLAAVVVSTLLASLMGCGAPLSPQTDVGAATTSSEGLPTAEVDATVDRLPPSPNVSTVGEVLEPADPAPAEPAPTAPNAVSSGLSADRDTGGTPAGGREMGAQPGG